MTTMKTYIRLLSIFLVCVSAHLSNAQVFKVKREAALIKEDTLKEPKMMKFKELRAANESTNNFLDLTIPPNNDTTSSIIRSIEGFIADEKWEEANTRLSNLRTHCGTDPECVIRGNFTSAYYFQQLSNSTSNPLDLEASIRFYDQVLEAQPGNAAASYNAALVNIELNRIDRAVELLDLSMKNSSTANYNFQIADLLVSQGKFTNALARYTSILKTDPGNREAYQGIIDLYESQRDVVTDKDLVDYCQMMVSAGLIDMATTGLARMITRTFATKEQDAIGALLWWAMLASEKERIELSSLPSTWAHKSITQLRMLVDSSTSLSQADWWDQSTIYRSSTIELMNKKNLKASTSMAYVLRYLARKEKANGNLVRTEELLVASLTKLTSNNVRSYGERTGEVDEIFFKLATELGFFYTQHRDFPDAEKKFKQLEGQLLDAKGDAYGDNNSEAIIKFHTALGLIYADRDVWRDGISWYANGIYQLSHAIDKTPESKNTAYLRMLLADGYNKLNQTQEAKQTLVDAAMNYLNNDELEGAELALKKYDNMNGASVALYPKVKSVLDFRNSIEDATADQLRDRMNIASQLANLKTNDQSTFYFDNLQHFKILNELGKACESKQLSGLALQYKGQSLVIANKLPAFSTFEDVSMVYANVAALQNFISFDATTSLASFDAPLEVSPKQKKVWRLYDADGLSTKTMELETTPVYTAVDFIQSIPAEKAAKSKSNITITRDGDVVAVSKKEKEKYSDYYKSIKVSKENSKIDKRSQLEFNRPEYIMHGISKD